MSAVKGAAGVRDTRARLIDVAERLFAEYGIEAVSLRMVGTEAGQRNNSAVLYHFGSKDGLIAAIIDVRSAPVDARRAELAAALRAGGGPPDPAELIGLLLQPLVETIGATGERTWYLRFLANVMDHPMFEAPWRPDASRPPGAPARPDPPAMRHLRVEWRRLLPDLPDAEFERRTRWTMIAAFRLLADYERQRSAAPAAAPPAGQVVADLTRMLLALMQAPHPAP
ncbi:helix-turn-helix transcriptional regulator [Actinomadura sp. NAK00032]|uniref:TetR/AcrR family transcriptional regulator n=1 Tax=Actinomadura sp. NAK00032 TaxID=2742128 RepID=UPI0015918809|nr:helix-turn-helix domain-containing protein [Actinomadura sp. NAK00032]QKW33713.1 helix-turn-helix transcriptional regulator [Actinomadura sp. NAK00032]